MVCLCIGVEVEFELLLQGPYILKLSLLSIWKFIGFWGTFYKKIGFLIKNER